MSGHKFSERARASVANRANRLCEYCMHPLDYSHTGFVLEHIIPIVKGGTHKLTNIALACDGCNSKKWVHTHAIDPLTNDLVELFNPRMDKWDEHFYWRGLNKYPRNYAHWAGDCWLVGNEQGQPCEFSESFGSNKKASRSKQNHLI